MPQVSNEKAFIFSTSAIQGEDKVAKDHSLLSGKLQAKGYLIVGESNCKGFNTNSFPRYLGGMNRCRPNAEDLKHAEGKAIAAEQVYLKRLTASYIKWWHN